MTSPQESSPRPATGRIIFLNGTSSSGKSSVAAELLRILEPSHYHLAVDAFHAMRSKRHIPPDLVDAEIDRTVKGFHRAVAGMAAAGNPVVVDHVLGKRWRLLDCLEVLPAEDVVLIGLRCPRVELLRREQARGDRPPGLAALQFDRVHAHGVYDLECDTHAYSPAECARRIRDFLPHRPSPTAFERLRRILLDG
ncbi:chloramphenicol phosphotransferase CPT family protein [Embleya scabrispora]|uniref:chloramphenicol phosphotransferase CPT family protein n=1 Tax=Embleya scabrispora TaxID=159449 RepID=UPI000379B217|nr:AAA family ATPase [Embleya scabrispora]MYS87486.1 AAA family ATPase [Streptomyces sp. SID5474]